MGQLVFQATAGGQVALVGPNPSSNFSLNVPAVNGTLVTTGDTGTVTNTMLANSAIIFGSTSQALGSTVSALNGVSIGGTTASTGKFTSITNSGLTANQVVYAGTAGLESGSANMVFDGSTLTTLNTAYTGTLTGGTGVVNLGSGQFYKDASGNVGIGTTGPNSKLQVTSATTTKIYVENTANSVGLRLQAYTNAGLIQTDTNHPLTFATNNGSEAMRINTSGYVLVGCTALPSSSVAGVSLSPSVTSVNPHFFSAGSATGNVPQINFINGNGTVGQISTNGSLTTYAVSSDRRLKENITPLTTGLSSVLSLKPSQYNYKADPTTSIQGFIADELQQIVPHAVLGEANAVDEKGNPVYQGVDASFLIPHLVSAIQELNAKITALENK